MNWAILELYCGESGKLGYYNSQSLGLARALSLKGINITVVYPAPQAEKMQSEKTEDGITILRVPCKTLGVHAFYKLDFLLKRKIDVVQLNSDNQIYAPSVMKYCKKHRIFYYSYIGTLYSDTGNYLKKKLMDMISARNMSFYKKSLAVAKTSSVKKCMEEHGVKRVEVVSVGLDLTEIKKETREKKEVRRSLGFPENKKIILFVGRLENYKRPFAALEVLKALGEDYFLVIIGSGSLKKEIERKICQDKMDAQISYIEKVPNSEMYQYYYACDYYVNFNTHEIFGMSILEAMYQNCIVVARRALGPQEIIEDKISGYLCDTDKEMISIIRLEDNKAMRQRAEERICKNFTWDKRAEKLVDLVKAERKQI